MYKRQAFVISSIPLGGYVKLLDENHGDSQEKIKKTDLHRAFNRQPLFKRSLIVLAGPLINLFLAILIFFSTYMYGSTQIKPLINEVSHFSEAFKKGLRAGDEVVLIDGEEIKTLNDLQIYSSTHKDPFKILSFKRGNELYTIHNLLWTEDIHLFPYGIPILIQSIEQGSIAEKIGLKLNDQILMIDQIEVKSIQDLVTSIQDNWLKSYDLSIKRNNIIQLIHVDKKIFESKIEKKRIGVSLYYDEAFIKPNLIEVKGTFLESFRKSLSQTYAFLNLTLTTFKDLFILRDNLKDLGGPLTIAHMASSSFLAGILPYIQFIGLISLNIGILNLLPIPLLDGGHLAQYFLEFATGKPLSNKKMMISQRVGVIILGLLTAIALYNDASRYLLGS